MKNLEIKVPNNCLTCNRAFNWHEVIIVKLPEGCPFCLDCSEKYHDDKVYKGLAFWHAVEFEPDINYIYDFENLDK